MENVAENGETYLNSSQKRPPRITDGGSGIYCCVPQCGSALYDKHKQKSDIGLFKFPENVALFIVWKKTIDQYRREGGADTFDIKKTTHEAMITDLKKENEALRKENAELNAEKSLTNFSYDNILLKEQLFKSLTGLPKTSFDALQNFVDSGEHCEKLIFYDPSRRDDDIVSPSCSEGNKRGRKLKILPVDQLFMFLVWLKNGLNLDFTSWLFNSKKSTVSQMLIS